MKVAGMLAGLVALVVTSFASGASVPAGRIVFSAIDTPASGDVMLVRADGSSVDLSRSPAYDTAPVLSPNGRLVAFYSTRGGRGAEYVVRIDGTGLRRISPWLTVPPTVVWAPGSRGLALLSGAGSLLYRGSASGGVWVRLARGGPQVLVGWSPDGRRLAYATSIHDVTVVDRGGKRLFAVNGQIARWSPTGRLAVERDSRTWQVYDQAGRRLASFAATSAAWSQDGRLASITPGGVVQVRPGGVGRPTVSARPVRDPAGLLWAGATHLLVSGPDGFVGYDLTHRATFELAAAYRTLPALAPDGTAFGTVNGLSLARSTLSGSTRTLASVPYCQGKDSEPYGSLQALPDASGAVYVSDCAPPHDLFSVAPDGSGLARLTSTTQDELDPALSPDGTRLAFALVDGADCVGCDHQIWTGNLDGSGRRPIALPASTNDPILQDDRPSFSPDGKTIVFSRWDSSLSDAPSLAEAPATGGAATTLKVAGGNPAWGPSRIAFDGSAGVETVGPDGSGAKLVPGTQPAKGGVPAWSADGRLALLEPVGGFSILLPATGRRIPLPGLHQDPGAAPGLTWSPDAARLAFTAADANGIGDVWTVGVDGSGLRRVTHGLGADGALAWR